MISFQKEVSYSPVVEHSYEILVMLSASKLAFARVCASS